MFTLTHHDVWVETHGELRQALGEERFARWIAPLKVLSREGTELRLGVHNRFVLEWVERCYLSCMQAALRARHGKELRISLEIDPGLFRERRLEGDKVRMDRDPKTGGDGSPAQGRAPANDGGATARTAAAGDIVAGGAEDMTLENFVVGLSNRLGFNAALQVLDSPGELYNPLFIHGPPGVGKTHLLKGLCRAFRQRRRRRKEGAHAAPPGDPAGAFLRVSYLTGEQFFNQFAASVQDGTVRKFRERYRSLDVLLVDDIHLLINKKKTQEEFLHTFNSLADGGRQVVLASDSSPKSLTDLGAGLVGRFVSGLVVGIKKPDYETRLGIARLEARRLQLRLDESLLAFVAERVRGSARELIGALKQIAIQAQVRGGDLDLRGVEEALAEFIREDEQRLTLASIQEAVAAHFRLAPEALASPSRLRQVAIARQVAMFLARRHTRSSLCEIGRHFGKRNHTTVRCAIARVEGLIQKEGSWLAAELRKIRETHF